MYLRIENISKKLSEDKDKRISTLVFVDDIIGSGGSIIDGIKCLNKTCGEVILNRNIKVVIATICGLESGRDSIEKFAASELPFNIEIYICDMLNDSNRCFTHKSLIFEDDLERQKAREIVYRYGIKLDKKQPLGYDDGQLLIIFPDTCPNSSLPILWCSSEKPSWIPLFKRH